VLRAVDFCPGQLGVLDIVFVACYDNYCCVLQCDCMLVHISYVKENVKVPIVNIALSQLCHPRVRCSSPFPIALSQQ